MKTHARSLAAVALLLASATAGAQPFLSATVSAGGDSGQNSDNASDTVPITLGVSGTCNATCLDGFAAATAHAEFGSLGAEASGSAAGNGLGFPVVGAAANLSFTDDLFIGGTPGTQVSLTFSAALLGSCFATPGTTDGTVNAACGVSALFLGPGNVQLLVDGDHTFASTTFDWAANSSLDISFALGVTGIANYGEFDAAYMDTAQLFVTTSTRSATITSASGHDYSLPRLS